MNKNDHDFQDLAVQVMKNKDSNDRISGSSLGRLCLFYTISQFITGCKIESAQLLISFYF